MEHLDSNSNRTWRLRVGSGGNPYSFVGAFGEAMPPQAHDQAPWIDEVWQMVAVDTSKNKAETPVSIGHSILKTSNRRLTLFDISAIR
jgi:hypothetical protein